MLPNSADFNKVLVNNKIQRYPWSELLTCWRRFVRWSLRRTGSLVDLRTLVAFVLPFALYAMTLAPSVYNLDSAELTTAAYTGGIVRSTGYPLYLTLGYLWSRIPLGDVGFRMNLFSAFNGALTIALLERILRRMKIDSWAIVGSLGLLATASYFWSLSLIAEVYTLHTALMAGILLLLLNWGEKPSPARLGSLGLLLGLSLGHHAATVLLIPGIVWYLLTKHPKEVVNPRAVTAAIAGCLTGLSIFLYLPLRYAYNPAFNYAGRYTFDGEFHAVNLLSPDGLWWLISGRVFTGQMLAYRGVALWREIVSFGIHLWRAFFAVGIGPGILGLIQLWRRNWRVAGMTGVMFLLNAIFYIDYQVVDKETMFLPTYLIWAIWAGVGYHTLLSWFRASSPSNLQQWSYRGLLALILGGALLAGAWNWRLVDLSQDTSTRKRAEAILAQAEPGALVFGWWHTVPPVQYLQLVEGHRPDIHAVNRFLVSNEDLIHWITRSVDHRPVYIDAPPPDLPDWLRVEAADPMYRLTGSPIEDQVTGVRVFNPLYTLNYSDFSKKEEP